MQADPVAGTLPAAPEPRPSGGPPPGWPHRALYDRIFKALYALPNSFQTSLHITRVPVTDLYTLSGALGAAIEQSVVDNLNALRPMWDPDKVYGAYSFVRQNQVFPDVLLQTSAPGLAPPIIMGIELKGWWILAKEGEPSFRYTVCGDACADADLLAVFPWTFDEVISGTPRPLDPFVIEARHAAARRNHYWEYKRKRRTPGPDAARIIPAAHKVPYPRKSDKFNDAAASDGGGNFGRPRGGIMSEFIDAMDDKPFSGIPIKAWREFFKIFTGGMTEESLREGLAKLARTHGGASSQQQQTVVGHLVESLRQLSGLGILSESDAEGSHEK